MAACEDINIKVGDSAKSCHFCQKTKGEDRPGVKYCLDCRAWICSDCLKRHGIFSAAHTLSDDANESSPSARPCPVHKDMILKFFCKDCKEFICPMCRIDDGEHKTHDCINISEKMDKIREEVQAAIAELKTKEGKADDRIKALDHEWSTVAARLRELEQRLKQEIKTLAEEHQKLRNDTEKELLNKKKPITNEIKRLQKLLNDADATFSSASTDFTDASSSSDQLDLSLPEVPTFREGLPEAGLKIMLGEQLTHQNKSDILKLLKDEITSEEPRTTELKGLEPGIVFHIWRTNDSMKLDVQLKWSDQNRQVNVRINDRFKDEFMKFYNYNNNVLVSASLDVERVCSKRVASIIRRRHSMVQDVSILIQDTRMVFIGSQECIDRDLPSVENEIYSSDCMPTCVCQQAASPGGSFVTRNDHATKWLETYTEFLPTVGEAHIDDNERDLEGGVGGTLPENRRQGFAYSKKAFRKQTGICSSKTSGQVRSAAMNYIPIGSPMGLIKTETYKLKSTLELSIENTDLFNVDVEALLCFTDAKKTGGEVMQRALTIGGARLEQAISKLRRDLVEDQVIHLKCKGLKYIIISMCVTGYISSYRLQRSIRQLMDKVRSMKLSSVALPLLGAGRLQLSPREATRSIFSALMADEPDFVRRVHLVSTDAEIVREMHQVVNDEMLKLMTRK